MINSFKSKKKRSLATTLTNRNDLLNKLTASEGPVKNIMDAKAYLEQRSLIAINNNFES